MPILSKAACAEGRHVTPHAVPFGTTGNLHTCPCVCACGKCMHVCTCICMSWSCSCSCHVMCMCICSPCSVLSTDLAAAHWLDCSLSFSPPPRLFGQRDVLLRPARPYVRSRGPQYEHENSQEHRVRCPSHRCSSPIFAQLFGCGHEGLMEAESWSDGRNNLRVLNVTHEQRHHSAVTMV